MRDRKHKRMSTTTKTAGIFTSISRRVTRSPSRSKPAQRRVFGKSSQFAGVRVGKPGDPRR